MEQHKNKKNLKLPRYPGEKMAFQEFIRKNLRYPKEALEKKMKVMYETSLKSHI